MEAWTGRRLCMGSDCQVHKLNKGIEQIAKYVSKQCPRRIH